MKLNKSSPQDLPVKLVFEFGRIDSTIGDLKHLAPGSVIPLSRPAGEAIDIYANGKRIGSGTLVKVGDSMAARITKVFDLD